MAEIRILHVVTYMGRGGLETMLMNYYRHIDRDKVQFDFLVHRDFKADYDDEIESLGGKIYRIPRLVPWSKSYKNTLKEFFTSHPEYKIVHVHQDCLSSVALKCAKECGVPVRIAHSHNSSQGKNIKFLIKKYYMRKIPKYATELFACSKSAGDWMFRGQSYLIMNNAIDAKSFSYNEEIRNDLRKEFKLAEDECVIGHVGRFFEQKNHSFLIDIFREIKNRDKKAKLLLVGDGALRSAIEDKVRKLGLEESVIFAGIRKDMNNIYQAIDAFVLPSLFEGLPVVLVEAQASGLNCIVSDTVSDEGNIINRVKKLSLDDSTEKWADTVLEAAYEKRENTYDMMVASEYDIISNACWLQNYYLEKWREED